MGAIEPQFYAELLEKTGLAGEDLPRQMSRSHWPTMKERFEALFKQKTRDEWCELLEGSDACFAPVLTMTECQEHPHIRARQTFVEVAGQPPHPGQHTDEVLADYGFGAEEIRELRQQKAIA